MPSGHRYVERIELVIASGHLSAYIINGILCSAQDRDGGTGKAGRYIPIAISSACVDEDRSPADLYRQGLYKSRVGIGQLF
ncbi:unnamed protein product [Brassica rapa subsp. trilocularis]